MKEKLFGLVNSLKERFQKNNTQSDKGTDTHGEIPPYKQKKGNKRKLLLATGVGLTAFAIGTLGFLMFLGGEEEENIQKVLIHKPTSPPPAFPKRLPRKTKKQTPPPGERIKEKLVDKFHSSLLTQTKPSPKTAKPTPFFAKLEQKPIKEEKKEVKWEQPTEIVTNYFVGEQIKKALEEIKEEIKSELEKKAKRKKEKIEDKSFNIVIELPNLPSVITVNKIAELPDGTKMVYYNGKWLTKGVELDNGWKVIAIDDKYIYLKKTVEKTIRKDGKAEKISVSKVIKVGYIVSF